MKKNLDPKGLPGALSKDEIDAKLKAIAEENTAAQALLEKHFGAERWKKIQKQARTRGESEAGFLSLCGKMLRTRREWHPGKELAIQHAAAIGLLIAIGSQPSAEDVKAFEEACKA